MGEWQEYKLGNVADVLNGYAFKSDEFSTTGMPVIKIRNVASGSLRMDEVQYYPHEITGRIRKFQIRKKDILIAMTGSHITQPSSMVGRCCRYDLDYDALLNQRVGKLYSKDERRLNGDFLFYFLKQDEIANELAGSAGGSANQANISSEQIRNLDIYLPELPEQKSIALVLSSLDAKIDLLHLQNKTLEALAETLFRQWFVEEAEEGWKTTSLYDVIDLIGGGTPKTEIAEYWDGDIKWISARDITPNHKGFITETEKKITEQGIENSSAKILPKYATVISARGTVGKYCLLAEDMAFSQSNYGIRPRYKGCYFFTYLLVASCVDELQAAAYGSVFDTITTNTFKEHKIQLPPEREIQIFGKSIKPYFEKMLHNCEQIRTLTHLRDTLLPKLMSGEVRVKDDKNSSGK